MFVFIALVNVKIKKTKNFLFNLNTYLISNILQYKYVYGIIKLDVPQTKFNLIIKSTSIIEG